MVGGALRQRRGTMMLLALAFGLTAAAGCGAATRSASGSTPTAITAVQFANRADQICRRDSKQQAPLGAGLLNADIVTRTHLPNAAAYLDKIIAITNTETRRLAGLAPTDSGMLQRHALLAALRKILADERAASTAAHNGDLAGFRAAFNKFILHGYPTGPDYRNTTRATKAAAKIFPFKVCGKTPSIYP